MCLVAAQPLFHGLHVSDRGPSRRTNRDSLGRSSRARWALREVHVAWMHLDMLCTRRPVPRDKHIHLLRALGSALQTKENIKTNQKISKHRKTVASWNAFAQAKGAKDAVAYSRRRLPLHARHAGRRMGGAVPRQDDVPSRRDHSRRDPSRHDVAREPARLRRRRRRAEHRRRGRRPHRIFTPNIVVSSPFPCQRIL